MNIKINELIYQISFALDCVEKDLLHVTTNHTKRVAYLCILLGREMGFSEEEVMDIACAGILHDNALTEYILSEQGRAHDATVWKTNMDRHCVIGEENAKSFPFAGDVSGFILYHHENADGSGPFRKKASEIPVGAQLIRICDNTDALFALGKPGHGRENFGKLHSHVEKNAGVLYAKEVAEAYLRCVEEAALDQLSNEVIENSLRKITPLTVKEVSLAELINFSKTISKIIDYKSHFTKEHSTQIASKARIMANYYQFDQQEADQFYLAASLHDLGKLTTPLEILEKPGSLTDDEFEIMKEHVFYTYEMLRQIHGLEQVTTWASNHHEKLDGTGYPFGKKAENLDFNSRLLTCIDIYQALTEKRPYREGMHHSQAIKVLRQMAQAGVVDASIPKDMEYVFGSMGD